MTASIPSILRAAAAAIDGPAPTTDAERRVWREHLQRVVTAASWAKAEIERQMTHFLPLTPTVQP